MPNVSEHTDAETPLLVPEAGAVVLFDGVCNLCNGVVNFIIDRDPDGYFHFVVLQSETGQALTKAHAVPDTLDTILFLENGALHNRSTAALRIAKRLKGAWPLLYAGIILPRFIRDGVYNWIARNRYTWFGKQGTCRIPTPELRSRFLSYD